MSCGLKPDEFWDLTPREVWRCIKGRGKQLEDQMYLLAVHATWVMSCWTSGITPDRLLGRPSTTIDLVNDPYADEKLEELE